jgi:anti-sigma regulatory factor (Ser/Thr protein kinase)
MTDAAHLAIPARLAAIDDARTWAASHARAAGLDDDALADLELALTEALANVIRHGHRGEGTGLIDLAVAVLDDRIEVSLLDRAPLFVASDVPPRDLDQVSEGGYGLALIELLMDEVRRAPRPGGGNVVTLVKLRKGQSDD